MAANAAPTYDEIYSMVRNGYTGDSTIWNQTFEYIRLHPNELFRIAPNRKWSIGHQIIYYGGLKLFKSLLSLYNDENQINIFSPTKDTPKPCTILDIALERRGYYKEQYEYIEHLFAQDKFLQACKAYNWPVIDEMLNKDRKLLNEKPPYYSNYFIHYLVIFGDTRRFSEYNLPDNQFQFDLKNAQGKTALDLAREIKNQAVIDELQQLLSASHQQPNSFVDERDNRDEREDNQESPIPLSTSSTTPKTVPIPARLPLPRETLKRITCRITNKVFVDPVRASDGHAYERSAIIEWFKDNRYSPATGEPINETFTDDAQMKDLIRDLRQQNLIPEF